MTAIPTPPLSFEPPPGAIFGWARVRTALLSAVVPALLLSIGSQTSVPVWLARAAIVALFALACYGIAERWPRRLPRWLARWVYQLVAIAVAAPVGAFLAYMITDLGWPDFSSSRRVEGFHGLTWLCMLLGPWIALTAMLRRRDAFAREQALAFELERSELARQAADARLRLLQAQVQPHFLFNTLANVQALVDSGSSQASRVLRSLIAYLRAAVPRLDEPAATVAQEMALVRAYLDLMHLRMPDRLAFELRVAPEAQELRCPPLAVLTLVENAVRHGIDPSEQGGRIDIAIEVVDGRCRVRVDDTGVGLEAPRRPLGLGAEPGAGTGLANLRERLRLVFGEGAALRLGARAPQGTRAEVEFPARPTTGAAA